MAEGQAPAGQVAGGTGSREAGARDAITGRTNGLGAGRQRDRGEAVCPLLLLSLLPLLLSLLQQ